LRRAVLVVATEGNIRKVSREKTSPTSPKKKIEFLLGFPRYEEQAVEAVGHGVWARALPAIAHSLSSPREFTAVTAT
jgi:hypothetical protein